MTGMRRSGLRLAAILGLASAGAFAADPPPRVVINEIMYHPADPNPLAEFVELHNAEAVPVDLSGWRFAEGIAFTFPEGAVILPGGYLVLCADQDIFDAVYGAGLPVAGRYDGRLSNSGEELLLLDASGRKVQEIHYLDELPWPPEADGLGPSLELVDPALDVDDPYSWKAAAGGPTPGRVNSAAGQRLPLSMADAHHAPDKPQPGAEVAITVRVNHTAPVAAVDLMYEALGPNDNAGTVFQIPMRDDGVDPDAAAGDDIWSCRLPGLPAMTLVRYTFLARDAGGVTAVFPHPGAATPNRAYFVADYVVPDAINLWWIVMTPRALADLNSHVFTNELEPAAFVSDTGKVYDRIGIRYRGYWARHYAKKSWKLVFNGDRLFRGRKRINLNATMYDPAGFREHFAYQLFKDLGALYCDTEMVRVHCNRPIGSHNPFLGLFTAIEQVDARWARRRNRDGAAVYKSDSNSIPNSGDERYEPDPAVYALHYNKATRESEPWDDFIDFTRDLDELFGADEAAVKAFFEARVNLAGFYRWMVANACMQNWDAFNKNHFMVFDEAGSGKWEMAPWDCDRVLGDMWGADGYGEYKLTPFLGRRHDPGTTGWNRVIDRFFAVEEFRTEFLRQLGEALATDFTEERWLPRIDAQAAAAAAASSLDDLKWGGNWTAGVAQMRQYVTNRRNWLLQTFFPGTPPETPVNAAPADNSVVWRLPFTLSASPFAHPESGATHYSSRWQIARETDDWQDAAFDIVSETARTSLTVTLPVFAAGARWKWRVAYTAFGRGPSAWSAPTTFVLADLGYVNSPLSLAGAANVDVVLNAGDASNDPFDNAALFLIEDGYLGGRGLPTSRLIGDFVLNDYSGPNAVRCNRRGAYRYDIAIPVPPARYLGLEFLAAASPGDARVQVRLAYQDGSTADGAVQTDDWCDDTPERGIGGPMTENLRQAIDGMDRYGPDGIERIGDVGLFVCHVPANPDKVLQSVTLLPNGAQSWWFNSDFTQWNLMALNGAAVVSTVNFEAAPAAGPAPLAVAFTNRSYGSDLTGFLWSFGDGRTSTEVSPAHSYDAPGRFTVTLTAQRSAGGPLVAEKRDLVLVDAPIAVDFAAVPSGGETPLSVAFTNQSTGASIQSYRWEFGDGAASDLRHPIHVYTAPGVYTVALTAFGYGAVERREKTEFIRVFEPSHADFAADARAGAAPFTVHFTNLSQGENIAGFLWDFGDGEASLEREPVHRYATRGSYAVQLTAFTKFGDDLVVRKADYIVAEDLAVDFGAEPAAGEAPLDVAFTVRSSGVDVLAYAWDFGDGAASTARDPVHTYQAAGVYDVTLEVFGAAARSATRAEGLVQVLTPLAVDFTAAPREGALPLAVEFTPLVSGPAVERLQWDFGDGSQSAEANPTHAYRAAGAYTVSLTAAAEGREKTAIKPAYIVVRFPPVFLRGDPNEDGRVDLSDAVSILRMLFGGRALPACEDRLDANDDGQLSIADAIHVLAYLFAGGPAPPAPFPVEGLDATEDALRCDG